ncbi:DUF4326 domain-containing protein [Halorussus halophilus]|uniref:DUF4326 domain-containing protein n=1 Tax=Halorussus halophilus TaxID=2650975 RepID=UPI001300FE8F|nr:DUF4326 domain-containing protein [Halorussus halophilus]
MTEETTTEQRTLTGDPTTSLVNQKHTDEFDVDIGRSNHGRNNIENTDVGTPGWLGNPYSVSDGYSRSEAIEKYRTSFCERLEDDEFREAVEELRGKTLACWCVASPQQTASEPFETCHGEVILAYLQGEVAGLED